MIRKLQLIAATLSALSFVGTASALTANATLGVLIDVQTPQTATTCTVVPMNSINLSYVNDSAQGGGFTNLDINCNGNTPTPYTLTIDNGQNWSGTDRRAISTSGGYVAYSLTEMGMPIGTFTRSTYYYGGSGTVGGVAINATVIPGQTPTAGTYTDSLTVTLEY